MTRMQLVNAALSLIEAPPKRWIPRTKWDWIKFYAANPHGHAAFENGQKAISMGTVKLANDLINWDSTAMQAGQLWGITIEYSYLLLRRDPAILQAIDEYNSRHAT